MKHYLQKVFATNAITETRSEDKGIWRLLEGLPVFIPIFLASFGLATVLLICVGQLTNILVGLFALPFGIATTVYATRHLRLRFPGKIRERRIGIVVVLVFISAWALVNMRYSSEDVYVNRDPGLYNVTARWLMDHDNLVIHQSDAFGSDRAIVPDSAGFGLATPIIDDQIYAQAPHLFPALLGLVGRVLGPEAMMKTNAVIGAFALLAVYGLARLFVRPRWAVVAIAILALCLPMFYFSRDTYTEPLAMLLIFGALNCLAAVRNSKNYWLWAIAGIVAASGCLARLDAYILLSGFLAAIFMYILFEKRSKEKHPYGRLAAYGTGIVVTGIVGWWDVSTLSKRYFIDLRSEFEAQVLLVLLTALLGFAVLYFKRRTKKIAMLLTMLGNHKKSIQLVLVGAVILFAGFLVSRPLWMTSHEAGNPYSRPYIASLQAREGDKIDPHRNYAEYSAHWVTWYIGPVLAVLGLLGFLLCLRFAFEKEGQDLIPILLLFSLMAALYFLTPKITADQIWAIRRFLPVIIPALCVFGAIALQRLFPPVKPPKQKMAQLVLLAVTLAAVIIPPISVSYPFLRSEEFTGQLGQLERVCRALPRKSAVLLVGGNGINMTQTIRTYCEVPAERLPKPTKEIMAEAAQAAARNKYVPVVFVIGYEAGLVGDSIDDFTNLGTIQYQEMRRELTEPPDEVDTFIRNILIGKIQPDGQVAPIK